MKLKIYKLHENANEEELKFIEVEVVGNYMEYYQLPDENLEGFEYSRRFFEYKKDRIFRKMFPKIKPNYFIEIHYLHDSEDPERDDGSTIGGYSGYAHINFFQKQYLDWQFGVHWVKNPKIAINFIVNLIRNLRNVKDI